MPRKGKGGRRTGKPNTAYANRSDLNINKTPPAGFYGEGKQMEALKATTPPPNQVVPRAAEDAEAFQPPTLTGLGEPTARPGEPVTAGLDRGPGPGSEVVPLVQNQDPDLELRAIFQRFPSEDLRELLESRGY